MRSTAESPQNFSDFSSSTGDCPNRRSKTSPDDRRWITHMGVPAPRTDQKVVATFSGSSVVGSIVSSSCSRAPGGILLVL